MDTFPRQNARTQGFTLGAPRDVTVAPDGARVEFLRSAGPEDRVTSLWVLDLPDGDERCVVDPRALLASGLDELPAEERARRERAREAAAGLTSYATDAAHGVAAGALAGQLVVADLAAGTARLFPVPGLVIDPRPDPTGRRVAWVDGRGLWVAEIDDPSSATQLAGEADPAVRWGVAEFLAAEEMDRHRGYWWAPDGEALLVARVDDTAVPRWWISDPARPDEAPTQVAYPAAGTANADVSAWIVEVSGSRREVAWDRAGWPYLAAAGWDEHGPMVTVLPRDQRALEVRAVDVTTGRTSVLFADEDDAWVERMPGTPARLGDGRLVIGTDRNGTRQLLVGDVVVTAADVYVRAVVYVGAGEVLFTANPVDDATSTLVWRWSAGGVHPITVGEGVHTAVAGGTTLVVRSVSLDADGPRVSVLTRPAVGLSDEGSTSPVVRRLESLADTPVVHPVVAIHHVGPRRLATAILLPTDHQPGTKLPVLLDPYGGPHAQRVVRARGAFTSSQWFADQGFAVVVADGRGTPGRGAAWERGVHLDLATPVLEDQIEALAAAAELEPDLDLDRVAMRGWSFGGYLAALAVLRRPDAVHAAIAGAPVTDWALYDTFYTERYLGHPDGEPEAYARSSLLADAPGLSRPLLLVHGLADDNVVSAHTLRLSAALLSAGRAHQVLPLTGVTHMASQEDVAENLLLLQVDFLRDALAVTVGATRRRSSG
ncbi:MAG: prolyl oligopeptidase family serine peptidase [Acidimicrobiales bacterium]|nr:prolyl oligopeptidase family serine peptidase [Acidimicrobiales bacterium]